MEQLYLEQIDYLSNQYEEWNGYDFYRFIFPNNESTKELNNSDFSKPNAVYLYGNTEGDAGRSYNRRIMLSDTWEDDYIQFVEGKPKTLCSGLSYRGRTNKLEHAQRMNALIFDLDQVGLYELTNFFVGVDKNVFPVPTFIVSSGTGVHLYYVFEEPIDLFPNIKTQLKSLKYDLTTRVWSWKETSGLKEIQFQSISQGFRMVGSINEKYDLPVRAFKTGDRVTLSRMNLHVREAKNKVDILKPFKPSKMTREAAKISYPEWYERKVVQKSYKPKKWNIGGQKGHQGDELYLWWLNQWDKAKQGHRYFYLMCLSIYACKCDVPYSRLKKDMLEVFPKIDQQAPHVNHLTEEDVRSALEAYSKEYYTYTIKEIEILADFRIERSRRNYRKQEEHLKRARAVRDAVHDNWRSESGRKPKEDLVKEYIKSHPQDSVSQVAKALNISRPTVYRYWSKA